MANAAGSEGKTTDKAQEAGRQAAKAAGGVGGGLPGGESSPIGGSEPLTHGDKQAEAEKSNTEKNLDTAVEVGANALAPGAGTVIAKAGGIRGVAKKAGIISLIALAPLILIGFFIGYILNGGGWQAIAHVVTDKKTREFVLNIGESWAQSKGLPTAAIKAARFTNDHLSDSNSSSALAAPTNATKPEPGSIEDKLQKIDWAKSQFQTLPKNDCRYDLLLQTAISGDGKTRSIPKAVLDKQTDKTTPVEELDGNTEAGYCVAQKYPIYNMLWRQPMARDLNKKASLYLNYAAPKDSKEVEGSNTEVDKYVYNKTLKRVTSSPTEGPDLTSYKPVIDALENDYRFNVNEYNKAHPQQPPIQYSDDKRNIPEKIKKMYEKMAEGTSPYSAEMSVNNFFNIPTHETVTDISQINLVASGISMTICPFVYTFMDINNPDPVTAKNVRLSIESRLTGAERGSAKSLTMTDTRKADALNSNESNATIQQNDNWASSTAYQIDVYNQLRGTQMNPEGTHNRAYNAPQSLTKLSPEMSVVAKNCFAIAVLNKKENKTDQDLDTGYHLNQELIASYNKLKASIKDESPGVFNSVNDFGLEQIITAYVRTGSITAVSGLEPGPDNYNRQSMGLRQLMNDYTLGIGGRFLTDIEAKELAIRVDGIDRQMQRSNGIAYRLFNTSNIHSLASIILQNTITPNTTKTAVIGSFKNLLSPLNSLADLNSNITFFITGFQNRAFAADITGDQYFKIDTAGFTPQELAIDPLDNAHIIEAIKKSDDENKKRTLLHYDECFKAKIPTKLYFDISEREVRNDQNNLTGYKRYFTYYPEKSVDLNTNKQPINDSPDSEFNKYYDCKFLLQDAKDLNNPSQMLAIRYRLYTYYNTQLDYLGKLSSDESDTSIYANSGGVSTSGGGSIVSGSTIDLATQILANTNIAYDPGVKEQFQQIANGENPVVCGGKSPSELVMGYILGLAKSNKLQISSFVRPGDSCSQSPRGYLLFYWASIDWDERAFKAAYTSGHRLNPF
jgi:hypothetical protein